MDKREKQRLTQLMILICCTIFTIILIGESILLKWETGAVVLLILEIIVCWVAYVTEKLSASSRIWMYSIVTMLTIFFYGIHETSIYDLAPLMIFIIVLYSTAEICAIVNLFIITYYFTMLYDFIFVLGDDIEINALLVTRTLLHLALVYVAGYMAKAIIKGHIRERKNTDSKIAELEEINRKTEDFLTNVSHELRTPINVVTGVTTVMLKSEEDTEKRKDILSIQMAGYRLFGQIEDILDYTEIETGRIKISEDTYMISSLINDIISEKNRYERNNALELIFDIDAGVPCELLGDGKKIKKIINHLVDNALKFTKIGGVYVRLFAIPKSYGVNICIRVSDTGIGIDAEHLEKVTEKFYQTNAGRNRSAGGLGLGLSIVYGLVSAMEGFIQIESSKETGTTVSVSIPQKVVNDSPCMKVEKQSDLCLACFLKIEKYATPKVRDYYSETIANMTRGLNVSLHKAFNIEGLKSLLGRYQVTHILIGKEEYKESSDYFEYLDGSIEVIVIADDSLILPQESRIKLIRKPFYCLPLVNILNAKAENDPNSLERKNMICPDVSVLVVDDEPMNLMVAEGIFKDYQMKVKTAGSGMEAIELCRNEDFDLVFLDHMMPEMDGVETLKHLRHAQAETGKPLTVIAFTANAVSGAREMFLKEGFDEFVSKPIEYLELERVLRKVLPKSSIAFVDESDVMRKSSEKKKTENIESNDRQPENDGMKLLENKGIHTQSGMRYCGGDKEFYVQMLIRFAQSEEQNASVINEFLRNDDFSNYRIRVHALKSSAKMIGANSLSEMARKAEDAAKIADADYIREHNEEIITRYHELSQYILQALNISENNKEQTIEENKTEISNSELIERLTELKEVLDTFEADKADSLLTEMSGFVWHGTSAESFLQEIKKDAEDFEFSSASEKAETLIRKIESGEAL